MLFVIMMKNRKCNVYSNLGSVASLHTRTLSDVNNQNRRYFMFIARDCNKATGRIVYTDKEKGA